ncbi:TetR/AcrR family transcriptional regulator [Mycolicibacterium helvum]|uniref:Putative transcriptional regulator, TetR family protein n=1 Tax=Mycolicibacterium helvum TaxID=1534349 RepID=A0A7I7T8V9_9MYCO|nr:TetR family transcriptional regulator [Mycolicibacterium helvum]BBY65702.1 putative transcriptional regulator, TetR family protein [Mycolicibacterium helvum]
MSLSSDDDAAESNAENLPQRQRHSSARPSSELQSERRLRILDVAARVGLNDLNMRDVATDADISTGTLYRYFPSKVHLLISTLEEGLAGLELALDRELRPIPGGYQRLRIGFDRIASEMERTKSVTETLMLAYIAAHANGLDEAYEIRWQAIDIFKMLLGEEFSEDRRHALATFLADVWTGEIVSWAQRRTSFDDLRRRLTALMDILETRLGIPAVAGGMNGA